MHFAAIAFSVGLCVTGYVYILKAVNEQFQIQHEINQQLPPDKKFEPSFWWWGTYERFRELQLELLPSSPRPHRLRKFRLIGFLLLGSGMVMLLAAINKLV